MDKVSIIQESALHMTTGVGISQKRVTTPEDAAVPETVFRSETVHWDVGGFKSK